jgi:hypothetical protein
VNFDPSVYIKESKYSTSDGVMGEQKKHTVRRVLLSFVLWSSMTLKVTAPVLFLSLSFAGRCLSHAPSAKLLGEIFELRIVPFEATTASLNRFSMILLC